MTGSAADAGAGTPSARRALVLTVSTRAAAGVYPDRGGPVLAEGLRGLGFDVDGPLVVPDGPRVETELRRAVAAGYGVVLTTGGTGLTPTDRTPEATRALLEFEVPGLAEAIRARGGGAGVPTACLSRGVAGVAGRTLLVNLPGSSGGCRDGLAVLAEVLVHAVEQVHGGDHPPAAPASAPTSAPTSAPASAPPVAERVAAPVAETAAEPGGAR